MNGEMAQYFALATHGSAWLTERTPDAWPHLERDHSTFQFVQAVTFGGTDSVLSWLKRLATQRVDRIWLTMPDLLGRDGAGPLPWHQQAAFAGGIPAGLLTTSGAGNELWRASWTVGNSDVPDQRIWQVNYHNTRVSFGPQRLDVQDAATALLKSLHRAHAFAARHDLDPWQQIFTNAQQQWFAADAEPVYHQDLFPDGCYDPASRRLASMAQAAWVFGGMVVERSRLPRNRLAHRVRTDHPGPVLLGHALLPRQRQCGPRLNPTDTRARNAPLDPLEHAANDRMAANQCM